MDPQQEIQQLQEQLVYFKKLIKNMSAPIIPSVVPKTILVPIAGFIFTDRFEMIRTAVLEYAEKYRDTERVIFDFTGVTTDDLMEFDYNGLASELSQLNSALGLMGLRAIYVGFNPLFVREIVHAGIQVELEVYTTFKVALEHVLNESKKSVPKI
ncbi:putative PAS/PAC sensor protein [Planococcus donghaensis MPA1U2]|uniref:Putative PAS/PAC sensor protein n=1 Tax=Planococcus donghaensis MPA1U2 TaxID=933115 RepID=E7REV5_9BACL|nr:STAS domain-containing protein [Planococcus donghaensis]EGA90491.1 putative PAS/PAC sensor protein [Planococcus donghaensis MPA1U2]